MPLIRTIQADNSAKIAIWHITEPESFFAAKVRIEREIHHPHKRLQHLAARYLLSVLKPDFPLEEIRITKSGKPYLPGNKYHFSLAHCDDYAVAIVSQQYQVGIDVERITAKVERVAHKFLNEEELTFIRKDQLYAYLTLCWSAKEAVYKWYGNSGLDFRRDIHLQSFDLSLQGQMSCCFQKDSLEVSFRLKYILQNDYNITWLVDER